MINSRNLSAKAKQAQRRKQMTQLRRRLSRRRADLCSDIETLIPVLEGDSPSETESLTT